MAIEVLEVDVDVQISILKCKEFFCEYLGLKYD